MIPYHNQIKNIDIINQSTVKAWNNCCCCCCCFLYLHNFVDFCFLSKTLQGLNIMAIIIIVNDWRLFLWRRRIEKKIKSIVINIRLFCLSIIVVRRIQFIFYWFLWNLISFELILFSSFFLFVLFMGNLFQRKKMSSFFLNGFHSIKNKIAKNQKQTKQFIFIKQKKNKKFVIVFNWLHLDWFGFL